MLFTENQLNLKTFSAEAGMTLIELLIVVVVVIIIMGFALLNMSKTVTLQKDSQQRTRLMLASESVMRYRSMNASRSFARLCDVAKVNTSEGKIVPETVASFTADCTPQAINGWIVADNPGVNLTPAYLKENFSLVLYKSEAPVQMYCISKDGVVRRGTYSEGCNQSSQVDLE